MWRTQYCIFKLGLDFVLFIHILYLMSQCVFFFQKMCWLWFQPMPLKVKYIVLYFYTHNGTNSSIISECWKVYFQMILYIVHSRVTYFWGISVAVIWSFALQWLWSACKVLKNLNLCIYNFTRIVWQIVSFHIVLYELIYIKPVLCAFRAWDTTLPVPTLIPNLSLHCTVYMLGPLQIPL